MDALREPNLAVVRESGRDEPEELEKPPAPADDAPLLVLMGLASVDGAGELAFCTSDTCSPAALLIDTSKAWDPDGDGDLAAVCPQCDQAHWTTPLFRYIQENEIVFEDAAVAIRPELLLAQTVENLRAKAVARG